MICDIYDRSMFVYDTIVVTVNAKMAAVMASVMNVQNVQNVKSFCCDRRWK